MLKNCLSIDHLVNEDNPTLYCARCGERTVHNTLFRDMVEWPTWDLEKADTGHHDHDYHNLLRCSRCRWTIYLRDYVYKHIERDISLRPEDFISRSIYPGKHTKRPVWLEWHNQGLTKSYCFRTSEPKLHSLVEQMFVCVDNGAFTAAALMSRSIIETIMLRHIIDTGSLSDNVKAFRLTGKISDLQAEQLNRYALELGHASMHRSHNPSKNQVLTIIDFLMDLVNSLYVATPMMEIAMERVPRSNLNP